MFLVLTNTPRQNIFFKNCQVSWALCELNTRKKYQNISTKSVAIKSVIQACRQTVATHKVRYFKYNKYF